MIQIGEVYIREAQEADAPELANVHLNSWREAYRGIFPQDYLDQLPTSFKQRMNWWTKSLREKKYTVSVAEANTGLIGFSLLGTARDESMKDRIELGAIYLFEKWKGKGIGHALMRYCFHQALENGFKKSYCWVVDKNPTRSFYERTGGRLNDLKKTDEIGGEIVNEVSYSWDDLESFKITEPITVKFNAEKMSYLVDEITDLLHRSYGALAARGMHYTASHQPASRTLERLCEGESYVLFLGKKVVGTISLVGAKSDNPCEYYMKPGVYSFHQFAVDPSLQGKRIGSRMMDMIEQRALELGAKEIALDTSEKADNLISMYEKRGYRFVQHIQWSTVNYSSVIMTKNLGAD